MVDIDHFKSINDRFGHSTGDEVLKAVGNLLGSMVTEPGIAARYGGEEFCVLLPATDLDSAARIGEQMRQAVAALKFSQLSITTSLGVSCTTLQAEEPQGLLDQADKSLYVAKRDGRNQVIRFDLVPTDLEMNEKKLKRYGDDGSISYQAVTSLLSALAYRHPDTAAHSMRVAELSVLCAREIVNSKDAYVIEIGALLHDIGKIGVPDAILLKPGPLTKDEWTVMHIHDRIGMEIVEASFANRSLVDIVRYHHSAFGPIPNDPEALSGRDIPLGARIVTIADAYDAIISDRIYRKGRSKEEAFAELRRCAGRQFDPDLVEHFIKVVENYQPRKVTVASKYVALQIGLQLEKLTEAVDTRDFKAIKLLASRLEATASSSHIPEIREVAARIGSATSDLPQESADESQELLLLRMTQELIDLCRSTQRAYSAVELSEIEAFERKTKSGLVSKLP
jgi:diguanylate cyclase (GGDEF)-like protein/putative nucleotidyltransferase with HDIG domain